MSWPNVPWAQIETRDAGGYRILIPVRHEQVAVEKQTVTYEEIEVRREMVEAPPPGS